MIAWWHALTPLHQILYTIAVPATLILLIQTVLTLFGLGDHDSGDGVDIGADADLDGDGIPDVFPDEGDAFEAAHHDSGLRIFSVRGIVAFFCVGAWTGIALLDSGASPALSGVAALIAGLAALLLMAFLLRSLLRLQQSGNLDARNAVGKEGEVYLTVPAVGRGKVTVMVQERLTEFDALSADGAPIPTGSRVKVLSVTENQGLIITKVSI